MILKSIKWRLQAWHGLLLVCVLGGFGVTTYQLQRVNMLRHMDEELQRRSGMLLGELRNQGRGGGPGRPPPGPDGLERERPRRDRPGEGAVADGGDFPPPRRDLVLSPHVSALFDGETTNAFYYVLWRRDGAVMKRSDSAGENIPLPPRTDLPTAPVARMRGNLRESYLFTPPGECVLVGRWAGPDLAELRRFAWRLGGAGLAVLVLGLAGGWWMATRAIRPVEKISAIASRISAGHLSERICVEETDDELGRLAGVLNSAFARLDSAFTQQQQFTADASHELRTPISIILTQTQTALNRDRSPSDYREALQACQRAAQRMRQLTESLLVLARLDAGQESPRCERSDSAIAVRDCVDMVRPLADERRVVLQTELEPAEWDGNPGRLVQVITNLLANAIQHSPDAGRVQVATRCENGSALLSVTDEGPGVPPEALPRIFERFYRADESRNRRTGGVGLGLAIVKSCVEADGGSIVASNLEPHGLQMVVRLPAAKKD